VAGHERVIAAFRSLLIPGSTFIEQLTPGALQFLAGLLLRHVDADSLEN
jgi:hypothetical protein